MKIQGKNYQTTWLSGTTIKTINQLVLPHEFRIEELRTHEETAKAISDMLIRGAIVIGAFGAYGMMQAAFEASENNWREYLEQAKKTLAATRPTAQNLFTSINYVYDAIKNLNNLDEVQKTAKEKAEYFVKRDLEECKKIGEVGNELIKDGAKVLTHCNAGWLACVDWGTALSPVYHAHRSGKKVFVYADETRPRLQGAKLTAWELGQEGVPHKVIADNASAHYMRKGVDLVIVGADRVASNGDVANKIGTFEKAIVAHELGIPFYVAIPLSTIDMNVKSGEEIPIEERSEDEVRYIEGMTRDGKVESVRVTPEGSGALNPAFDVTPAKYVTGIITARGIVKASEESVKSLFE